MPAQSADLRIAAAAARDYTLAAIAAADQLDVGHGHGPLHHFSALWPET